MQQDLNEIEEIKKQNVQQGSYFDVWPVIMFFLGLIIAAMVYKHTL